MCVCCPSDAASSVHLGWSVDVASVVANLQGADHRSQDGRHKRGCQMALPQKQN